METTKFEQTIAMGIAEFIKFLDRTLETGADDPPCKYRDFWCPRWR